MTEEKATSAAVSASTQKLLHDNVSHFFSEFAKKYESHMSCRAGCSCCCYTDLTVFVSEAAEILRWFFSQTDVVKKELVENWKQSKKAGPDAAGNLQKPCVFLANNRCTIYEARPTICRSQGLPLLFRETNLKTKETILHVDYCPLNFVEQDSLPPRAEWLDLDRLNTLQSLASQQPCPVFSELKDFRLHELCNKDRRVSLRRLSDELAKRADIT